MGLLEAIAPLHFRGNFTGDTSPRTWLSTVLFPSAAGRIEVTQRVMLTEFVPVLLSFYLLAALVQLPNTRVLRLSILPAMSMLAWRVSTRYDYDGSDEPGYNWLSMSVCWFMSFLMLRAADFATSTKPFVRTQFSALSPDAPKDFSTQLRGALLNAFDLTFNARGVGWDWGKSIYVPPRSEGLAVPKNTPPAIEFLVAFLKTQVFFDFVLFAQQSWTLSPSTYPTHKYGGTIFDPDLPPLLRYGKVAAMSILCPIGLCTSFQATYYAVGFIGMAVFGQSQEQWPPLFQEPWRATSLGDFWGLRWHQVFKRAFVVSGAKPAARVFGRLGGLVGAFFVSGLMHDAGVWGAGIGTELSSVTFFFVMMAVGIAIEVLLQQKAGIKVQGFWGWVWTMSWLLVWGSYIVDAWARRGLIISKMSADNARPALYWVKVVQRWVELHGQPLA
ncbi:membrane bound O-acyl transferase family-domain-containing protein [Gloeopeniophorella convolvens]|nr:membrane bound O-acyl transferase family-domain-containing protein [Gloeopeniophorella convolvens]